MFSCVARDNKAFLTASPASRPDVVIAGGLVKMVMIYVAVCLKKATNLTCGNGTEVGKNITVLQSLTLFVLGK